MSAYIRKRRPLEIEITFKTQDCMSAPGNNLPCILYVDRMLRTRGPSKVLQDSNYNNG